LIIQDIGTLWGANTYLAQSIRENDCKIPEQTIIKEEADGFNFHPDWWFGEILLTYKI
jgi:hypothetical protein